MEPSSGQQLLGGQGVAGSPAQQPVLSQQQQALPITHQSAKKKAKKILESSSLNKKMKNSTSEKRGSIVKSIDKLASSIAMDETNSASMESASASSGMMPMMLMMQMQHQQQQMQLQYQHQIQQQQQMM